MSAFDAFPKGIMVVNHQVDAKKLGGDCLIAYMGSGLLRSNKFHDQVQAAADAGLPLVAFYENDPGTFVEQYQTLNLDHWLKTPEANWQIKDCVGPQVMSGGVKRRIHGLILGMNKLRENANKTFPDSWVIATAQFMARVIWKLYQIPVYFYMDPGQATKLAHGPKDEFTTFLSKLVRYDPQMKVGVEGTMEGIGTYLDAISTSAEGDWANFPMPNDGYASKLSDAARESGLGNAPRISWWCYSTGDYTMPGVSGGTTLLFLYRGSKARLYDELDFAPGEETPEPEPTTPEPPAGSGGSDGEDEGELPAGDVAKEIALLRRQLHEDMVGIAAPLQELTAWLLRLKG